MRREAPSGNSASYVQFWKSTDFNLVKKLKITGMNK